MINEIENGAAKTKQAIQDATETVAETAKTQGSRIEKAFRFGMKMLPMLPERSFAYLLDRAGLERKSSPLSSIALFVGGFAAGSVVTAFATPVSGPKLRKQVWNLVKSVGDDIEEKAEQLAEGVEKAEKKVVNVAKDAVKDAKMTGKEYADELESMKAGLDARRVDGDRHRKGGLSS